MRYIRQKTFPKLKGKQEIISQAKVCIIGCGATGTLAAELLTRTGVKELILIDRDLIELNNLQRQTLFTEKDVEKPKVIIAKEKLNEINSEVEITSHFLDLDYTNINLINSDLILDCTDNLQTRFLINDYAHKNKTPWIFSAVLGDKGYIKVFNNKECFQCIFSEVQGLDTCETGGILNTTINFVVSAQVTEAFKILTKQEFTKELIAFNVWDLKINKIKINPKKDCPACNNNYEYLEGKKEPEIITYCSGNNFQIKGQFDYDQIKNKLKNITTRETPYFIKIENMTIFKDNRVLIHAQDKTKAKSLYAKYIGT